VEKEGKGRNEIGYTQTQIFNWDIIMKYYYKNKLCWIVQCFL
jgi:hypothetical protein